MLATPCCCTDLRNKRYLSRTIHARRWRGTWFTYVRPLKIDLVYCCCSGSRVYATKFGRLISLPYALAIIRATSLLQYPFSLAGRLFDRWLVRIGGDTSEARSLSRSEWNSQQCIRVTALRASVSYCSIYQSRTSGSHNRESVSSCVWGRFITTHHIY